MAGLNGELVIIIGPAGAGKSVQAERLARLYGWQHLATGELLRQSNDPTVRREMESGGLADTRRVEDVLLNALTGVPVQTGIILDGFPRTVPELQWLERALPVLKRRLRQVLLLDVDQPEATARLTERGRSDDTPGALLQRWHEYQTETLAVVQHFGQRGVLVKVDGAGEMDEVTRRLREALA